MSKKKLAYIVFLFERIVCLETKTMMLVLLMRLYGMLDFLPPCAKWKNLFSFVISQVALSGPTRRFWREDLAPVDVFMTAAAVATSGFG